MTPTNPYEAPLADLTPPETDLPVRPVRGILLGLVVDFGGTLVGAIVLGIVFSAVWLSQGVPQSQFQDRLQAADDPTTGFGFAALVLGLVCSWAGGWVCVRVSRGSDLRYPAIQAALASVVGLVFGAGTVAPLQLVVLSALSVVAILLGGWIALQGRARRLRRLSA